MWGLFNRKSALWQQCQSQHLRKSLSPTANLMSSSSSTVAFRAKVTAFWWRKPWLDPVSSLLMPPPGSFLLVRSKDPPWLHLPFRKRWSGGGDKCESKFCERLGGSSEGQWSAHNFFYDFSSASWEIRLIHSLKQAYLLQWVWMCTAVGIIQDLGFYWPLPFNPCTV